MTTRRLPLAASIATVLILTGTAKAVDTITLIPGTTIKAPGGQIRGSIESESPTVVKIGGQSIPVEQIEAIAYEGQPGAVPLAEAAEKGGSLNSAADLYKKAAEGAGIKPYIVQMVLFNHARILAEQGAGSPAKANEAIAALESYLKTYPQSRHLGPALAALANLQLQKGDADAAEKSVTAMAKVAWIAGRAAILKTEVMARRGQYDQAVATLDQLIASAPKDSTQARDAKLAKAKNLAALKKFDQAETLVKEVIKQSPPEAAETQAVAHNTLGDCLRAANRPKDALFAYLQTDILYDNNKEEHARALSEIAQLWSVLKQDGRAAETTERLKQLYPQSPYLSARSPAK
ncbi:MAG: tetratricopeptide repeat protein [Isosphaeraceae bacterium]